jgi:hypothetical protein
MPFNSDQTKSILLDLLKVTKKDKIAIGYELVSIDDVAPFSLTVPDNANYAEMRIEFGAGATGISARYLLLGDTTPPSSNDGIGLADLDIFDVSSLENLINFRIIATSGNTARLYVQYYK